MVLSKGGEEQVRGFGLGAKGKVDVMVEAENKLIVRNPSDKAIALGYKVSEESRAIFERKGEYISFTLRNTSASSIPLIIPTVMNPNLSPFSRSGVDLRIGQEIFFKVKRKKYILLTVDDTIKAGDEINVPKLIKKRKQELGLS